MKNLKQAISNIKCSKEIILFVFAACVCNSNVCMAQAKNDSLFNVFANEKNKQMNDDNVNSNVASYLQHWQSFLSEYNKLDKAKKDGYKEILVNIKYNLACTYAKTGNKKVAFDSLEHSGYTNYAHIIEDDDWKDLRNEKRFINFCNSISKLGILQASAKYNNEENKELPLFTYQDSSNEHLSLLRKNYKLDSVAGYGNDISRIINLLHWVHNLIPHDGKKNNPDGDRNAENYISSCKKNNGTLNCRGLGIVLNEVYLSEGFKSRYVTCYPKDSSDYDCHVITSVYSASLNKWVWMDPTNDAYIMNEKGELLGIEELRERLINEKPLLLNPDANWNHKSSVIKSYYLDYYMAKNLYKIECVANSAYNTETPESKKNRQFIQLIPSNLNYKKDQINKDKEGNPVFSVIYTTNASKFWSKP